MRISVIGTREPAVFQKKLAYGISEEILKKDWEISTGAADGIDSIGMRAAKDMEKAHLLYVYLPWGSYNKEFIPDGSNIIIYREHAEWKDSVYKYHPSPDNLTRGIFALHARNYGIISNSDAVIAFPGYKLGGTGQGIRIAKGLGINVITISPKDTNVLIDDLIDFIEQ